MDRYQQSIEKPKLSTTSECSTPPNSPPECRRPRSMSVSKHPEELTKKSLQRRKRSNSIAVEELPVHLRGSQEEMHSIRSLIAGQAEELKLAGELRIRRLRIENLKKERELQKLKEMEAELEEVHGRNAFRDLVARYLRFVFMLVFKHSWQILQERRIVSKDWEDIEQILYHDTRLLRIADNENLDWDAFKERVFELKTLLCLMDGLFMATYLTSTQSQKLAKSFREYLNAMIVPSVQHKCQQEWEDEVCGWDFEQSEIPLIFLMDIQEVSAISELMFDEMNDEQKDGFIEILFNNKQHLVRNMLRKPSNSELLKSLSSNNLQNLSQNEKPKPIGKLSLMKTSVKDFFASKVSTLQKALKPKNKDNEKPDSNPAISTLPSRDNLAELMFGDEEIVGGMSHNPLFKKSLSKILHDDTDTKSEANFTPWTFNPIFGEASQGSSSSSIDDQSITGKRLSYTSAEEDQSNEKLSKGHHHHHRRSRGMSIDHGDNHKHKSDDGAHQKKRHSKDYGNPAEQSQEDLNLKTGKSQVKKRHSKDEEKLFENATPNWIKAEVQVS